jgi:O-antigen/teichoic acid export membrane protein
LNSNLPGLRKTGINVVSIWSQHVVGVIVAIVTIPIITRHFGLEIIGIWLLVTQYVQHLTILELGLNSGLTRYLARYRAVGDINTASRYLSTSVLVLLIIGCFIIIGAPIMAQGLQVVFRLPSENAEHLYWLALMASITVGVSLPLRSGIGMLSSLHHFESIAKWEILALAVRLILVLICFKWFNPNLLLLGLITFGPNILGSLMLFLSGRRVTQDLTIDRDLISRQVLTQIFSLSGATLVLTISAIVVRQSSPMLVGYQLGVESVAILSFPILIVSMVMPFLGVANRLIGPAASQLAVNNNKKALYDLSTTVARYVISVGLLICLFLNYSGYLLLDLWLGGASVSDDALHQMAGILVIVFAGFALATPGFIIREVLVSVGDHWNAAKSDILGSILGVAFGFWLMSELNLGVNGMAVGVAIAFLIRGAGLLMVRGARHFSIRYLRILYDCTAKPLILIVAVIFVTEILSSQLATFVITVPSSVTSFCMSFVLWCFGNWRHVVTPEHKLHIVTMLNSRWVK